MKNQTHIPVRIETKARLKKYIKLKEDSYDKMINKLLDEHEKS